MIEPPSPVRSLRASFDAQSDAMAAGIPFWIHQSFQDACTHSSTLRRVRALFPSNLLQPIFQGQREIETVWSSYKDHGYGHFFYWLTRALQPTICIELGVLEGFSLCTIAAALRDNGHGVVRGFDLFEEYPYHHDSFHNVQQRITRWALTPWALIERADAYKVFRMFKSIDVLHVDISNTGETYRTMFNQWSSVVQKVMIFEGGGTARDRVDWMRKYKKLSIRKALKNIVYDYPQWTIFVFDPYPSLTVALREPKR